jgi:BMFP domain-containing protein YqiC
MAQQALLGELARRLGDILPGKAASEDLEKSVKTVVQSVFSRLELVTREEFDAQLSVLNRTRERVQQLEAQLEQLSTQLDALDK